MTRNGDESGEFAGGIAVLPEAAEARVEESPEALGLGQWYWVKASDDEPWLGCVTHVGSNYAEMTSVGGWSRRVHFDEFYAMCEPEDGARELIASKVEGQKSRIRHLMKEVEALTARLGVGNPLSLKSGQSEGAALARLGERDQEVGEYKTALVKAKEDDLPALFKEIESAQGELSLWMKADTIPLKAQVKQMMGVTDRVDDRIFNVELYAGLAEQVIQFAEGEPAPMTEKIRLMQRRHYMDEECLARYEVGGMEFKDIDAFDAWLARPENRDRILPFPRCVVAFQVRRKQKERPVPVSLIQLFHQIDDIAADKFTFLYIRNGENLYRLSTRVEFTEQLFPDAEHHNLTSGDKLWANTSGFEIDIITDAQYRGKIEDWEKKKAEYERKRREHPKKVRDWKARKRAAKKAGESFKEAGPHLRPFWGSDPRDEYEEFEPNNVYYDDIREKIAKDIQQYNRIGLIVQGLLDRSPVFHPHPPWKIWSEGGFEQAIEMVYDDSRAMVADEKPDFEAYRRRLNKSLKTGSVTVGQREAWVAYEKAKDEELYRPKHRYWSDDGPETVARIEKFQPRARKCTYAWRKKFTWSGEPQRSKFTCPVDAVLNVDAYVPGDFKIFFSDPRTRAEYLQWAPLLLEAEEYHAGNREVEDPPPPSRRKPRLRRVRRRRSPW